MNAFDALEAKLPPKELTPEALELKQIFREASSRLNLNEPADALLRLADTGHASAAVLLSTIESDPNLVQAILKMANLPGDPTADRLADVESVINRVGQRETRSLAIAILLLESIQPARDRFSSESFSKFCYVAASLARHFFSIRSEQQMVETIWTVDTLFTIGYVHEVGAALMAALAPTEFDRTAEVASENSISFGAAFELVWGNPLNRFAAASAASWNMPKSIVEGLMFWNESSVHRETAALSCVSLAHSVLLSAGLGWEEWTVNSEWSNPLTEGERSAATEAIAGFRNL